MSHHLTPADSDSPRSQSESITDPETMTLPLQDFELNNEMRLPLSSTDVVEAVLSQPDVKDQLNRIYRDLGLGKDISAAFKKSPKRTIEEVSDAELRSLTKKPKPKKSKPAVAVTTESNSNEPEREKKEKHTIECISCRNTRHISQSPKRLPSSSCTHGREMCRMCIIAWIRSQVQDGRLPRCALCHGTTSYEYVEDITKCPWNKDILIR